MKYVVSMLISDKNEYAPLLRKAGLKATPARIAILNTLKKAGTPITAEEIIAALKKNSPDQATIYRALKELKNSSLIRQIDFQHGHAHYELADSAEHHHIICTVCEKIEDFTGCNFESIIKTALGQSREFKQISRHCLELFGICKSCARK